MLKTCRILDPVHGLIVFRENDEIDQLALKLINTREFQRLRRIRQLGFSEFVFPGATHTRFSHSIGVFHTARQLLSVIDRKIERFDAEKAKISICASLLHDLGHGPFSHTFEAVERERGVKRRHEEWTSDLISGDTEVRNVLEESESGLSSKISELLSQKDPKDIYDAVVSSQFDADRLDYLRRDRYMTGAGSGGFDFDWLLDCLEVGKITVGVGEEPDFVEVYGLYLNYKGLQAAESYLLARYHLYSQVYLHKTTRGAEKMLGALLARVARKIAADDWSSCGLGSESPLVRYYKANSKDIGAYSALDDAIIWAALGDMSQSRDPDIARLAYALHNRKLYKCFDVSNLAKAAGGDSLQRFRKRLPDFASSQGLEIGTTILTDDVKISAYGVYDYDVERGALQKVLIGDKDNAEKKEDIAIKSKIVAAIPQERLFRMYVPDEKAVEGLRSLWGDTVK